MPVYKKRHHGLLKKLWLICINSPTITNKNHYKKSRIKIALSIFLLIILGLSIFLYCSWEIPLISPLTDNSWLVFSSEEKGSIFNLFSNKNPKIVYGFLPYWNLDTVTVQPELTHLSYFGLNIQEDGSIVTKDADGNTHPGYRKLYSDNLLNLANFVHDNNNGQLEITLVQFEADIINKIVNNPEAHDNLINSIDALLLSAPVSGINIDIEYGGTVTSELRDNFALMIEKIRQHLETKFDKVTLSIDMYASASNNKQIWDVPRIAHAVDYLVVMAYDFHRRGSPQAGPVAPLFGGKDKWDTDIHQHLREYLRYVPKEKILLGIPFYGYGWQTESHSPQSNSFPDTGFTATYSFVQSLFTNSEVSNIITGWDDTALCPYISYEKEGNIYMIYYENKTSISYKVEYVKQLDLAGVAIWAIGYEKDSRELWDVIAKM